MAEQEEQRRLDAEIEVERLRALEAYQVGEEVDVDVVGVEAIDVTTGPPVVSGDLEMIVSTMCIDLRLKTRKMYLCSISHSAAHLAKDSHLAACP